MGSSNNAARIDSVVESDRIRLRRWRDDDRHPFAEMNSDPNVMEFLGAPLTRRESDAAIDSQLRLIDGGEPAFWAAERKHDERFIGFIGVKLLNFDAPFTPGYEIGWRLGLEYWGNGYASEGARAALEVAFLRWSMPSVFAITVPANVRSQAVMRKIGMHRVVSGDFNHPKLTLDNPLCLHILFRIDRAEIMLGCS
jgi:RimJ/RimL family protein N-acetyltransferase